ncbi:hypothetical protein ABPG75_005883 [Micractinium tetrahymenae]
MTAARPADAHTALARPGWFPPLPARTPGCLLVRPSRGPLFYGPVSQAQAPASSKSVSQTTGERCLMLRCRPVELASSCRRGTAAAAAALLLVLALAPPIVTASAPCPVYTIQAGDTIEIIAEQFGFTIAQVDAALAVCIRGYEPGTILQPAQLICLPGWVPACINVRLASRCPTCPGIPTCKIYTVLPGDTLLTIADTFAVPLWALLAANPSLSKGVLEVGMELHLPPWGPECPKQCLARSERCSESAQCCRGLACVQQMMAGRRTCQPCSAAGQPCSVARPCCNKKHKCVEDQHGRVCRAL